MVVRLVEETALRKDFHVPGETVVWRYMDIAKYLSLITTEKLWFARVSELRKTDPYEGALTPQDDKMIREILTAARTNW